MKQQSCWKSNHLYICTSVYVSACAFFVLCTTTRLDDCDWRFNTGVVAPTCDDHRVISGLCRALQALSGNSSKACNLFFEADNQASGTYGTIE